MRSKRLMTILLAACMLISILSPAVSAAQFAGGSADRFVTTDKVTNEEEGNSYVVSPEGSANVPTLKDGELVSSKLETGTTGQWEITEIEDLGADLLSPDAPACLDELKEAQHTSKPTKRSSPSSLWRISPWSPPTPTFSMLPLRLKTTC